MASAHLKWRHRAGNIQKICVESMREQTRRKNYIFFATREFLAVYEGRARRHTDIFSPILFSDILLLTFYCLQHIPKQKELFWSPRHST